MEIVFQRYDIGWILNGDLNTIPIFCWGVTCLLIHIFEIFETQSPFLSEIWNFQTYGWKLCYVIISSHLDYYLILYDGLIQNEWLKTNKSVMYSSNFLFHILVWIYSYKSHSFWNWDKYEMKFINSSLYFNLKMWNYWNWLFYCYLDIGPTTTIYWFSNYRMIWNLDSLHDDLHYNIPLLWSFQI